MKLAADLPLLETLLLEEEENQLRDEIANTYFLHQDPAVYRAIAQGIAKGETVENAYRKSFLSRASKQEKEAFAQVAYGMGLDEFKELNHSIEENPYFRLLQGLKGKHLGDLSFFLRSYAPYEVFLTDDESEENGRLQLSLGYYRDGLSFPALSKNEQVWMSLIPHEIKTMEQAIIDAKGKVLTLGLGLGYYAFMAAEKEEVTSVTVVENDPDVLAMFRSLLLPLFPHKEKITLVQADAFDFVETKGKDYDFTFVDIYHDETDGLPLYLKLLKIEQGPTVYWIERAILLYFRRYVLAFLEEQYDGYPEEAYADRSDFASALFGALYDATKEESILNEDALRSFLDLNALKALAKRL
ncbi:MAG: hypothetical protein IJU64_02265 [Bacilli bacterium]|nr:hypothetical protein [Bacilli bacterium]